jgi:hypothetical protein
MIEINSKLEDIQKKYDEIYEVSKSQMKETTRSVLFFVYFSGHGHMTNHTFGVSKNDEEIPIEEWVRGLSKFPRTFTIGLFDCCRVVYVKKGKEEVKKNADNAKG